jgi:cysteine-rich repeat protein
MRGAWWEPRADHAFPQVGPILCMVLLLAGCLGPATSECPGGGVCPAGLQCLTLEGGDVCVLPSCGNGQLDPGETCDDGNNLGGDDCRFDCREACGDGIVDPDEVCDDGNQVDGDGCAADCSSNETCGNAHLDAVTGEACDDGDLQSHDGCDATCGEETRVWTDVSGPTPRAGHATAYDPRRGTLVMFGGCASGEVGPCPGGLLDETWEWDGAGWTARPTLDAPSPRAGHAMTYDAARGTVVLYGGCAGWGATNVCSNPQDDTWEWNGAVWQRRVPGASPGPRHYHALAYDAMRERVVLFGGISDAGFSDEAWEWDGATWIMRSPTNPPPPGRVLHAMAYDPVRERVVVFGGISTEGLAADTWEWNGTSWTPTAPTPLAPRASHAIAYDAARGRLVAFGGCIEYVIVPPDPPTCSTRTDQTLTWDGGAWMPQPAGPSPSPRTMHALAYDTVRARIVLFGGDDSAASDETWESAGGGWTRWTATDAPPERTSSALVYDAARATLVLYGVGSGPTPSGNVWEWNGTWRDRGDVGGPTNRANTALAYDAARRRVVLFGGLDAADLLQDTWEWDGIAWEMRDPATVPPARDRHVMAYDAARGRVVMFGGMQGDPMPTAHNDLWEWDGADWTQRTPVLLPPGAVDAAMAYDVARGVTVLVGADTTTRDVWEWDGASWVRRTPTAGPDPGSGHALAYDPLRGRIVLFGGVYGGVPTDGTWEWDGAEWTAVITARRPGPRTLAALGFDASRAVMVLVGGTPAHGDTWRLRSEPVAAESCGTGYDADGDGVIGCDDPDCAGRCDPLCATIGECTGDRPHCGDGTCSALESCRLCPGDCGACPPVCGDFLCDPDESCTTCASDCPCP